MNTVHDKGWKGDRDRVALIVSYTKMCKVFRTPRNKRLDTEQIARMTNAQLYQASKDLYNGASIRKARKVAAIAGLDAYNVSIWDRIKAVLHV